MPANQRPSGPVVFTRIEWQDLNYIFHLYETVSMYVEEVDSLNVDFMIIQSSTGKGEPCWHCSISQCLYFTLPPPTTDPPLSYSHTTHIVLSSCQPEQSFEILADADKVLGHNVTKVDSGSG